MAEISVNQLLSHPEEGGSLISYWVKPPAGGREKVRLTRLRLLHQLPIGNVFYKVDAVRLTVCVKS